MYRARQSNPLVVIIGIVAGLTAAVLARQARLSPPGLPVNAERADVEPAGPGRPTPDDGPAADASNPAPPAAISGPPDRDEVRRFAGHGVSVRCVTFLPDGKGVLSGGIDAKLTQWDAATGAVVRRFPGLTDSVECVAVSADGRRIAAAGGGRMRGEKWVYDNPDFDVHLWDADSRPLRTLHGHEKAVKALAFLPDGRRLLSAGYDRSVRVWDAETGAEVQTLEGHTNWVFALAVSPDGILAASCGWDKVIRVWHLETGFELRTLTGHTGPVYGLAFSPDSKQLLSGSLDRTFRVWDVDTGKQLARSPDQPTGVTGVCYLPDGRHALTAGGIVQQTDPTSEYIDYAPGTDAFVRLWDVTAMTERHRFAGHRFGVEQVRASRDGRFAVSAGRDGTARVWRIDRAPVAPADAGVAGKAASAVGPTSAPVGKKSPPE